MKKSDFGKGKTIAVILADTDGPYNNQLWSQIQLAARNSKSRLIVFEGRALQQKDDEYPHNLIYDLATKFSCDGYILFSSLIATYISQEDLATFTKRFTRQPVPVVSISLSIPGAMNLLIDNGAGMETLIRHCIDVHHYRRFAYIGGPEKHPEAIERKLVFDKQMEKSQIDVDPKLVFDGDFSPSSGYQAAKHMVENNLLPVDCILCVNDETAMGVYMYLREQAIAGMDIPFPPVTGFDNTRNAQISRPGLTTVAQPISQMIRDAIDLVGENNVQPKEEQRFYNTNLVIRDSCGCNPSVPATYSDDIFFRAVRSIRVHQYMQTFSMTELFKKTASILEKCGIGDCYVVMYENPLSYPETSRIPEKATLAFAWQNQEDRTVEFNNDLFSTDQLLPDCCQAMFQQKTMIVKPLYFTNEHLGYMVFEPVGEDTRNYEPIRGQLSNSLKIISLLIQQQEMSNKLEEAVTELQKHNEKLNVLSLRDELTGLYNRRGFISAARHFFKQSTDSSVHSLLMYVDIDKMKKINDAHGHAAGDLAIRMTASVLKMSVREADIVARIGGDEFVILAKNVHPESISSIRDRIRKLLENYNEGKDHAWDLSFSIGTVSFVEGEEKSLDSLMEKADAKLYEEKSQKKAADSNP